MRFGSKLLFHYFVQRLALIWSKEIMIFFLGLSSYCYLHVSWLITRYFSFLKKKLFLPWDNKFYTLCISQFDSFTTTATILSCVIYYATVTYLLVAPIQKCCYSFILYLTAAISLSQVFGYLELNFNQTPFSGMGDSLLT